MKLRDILSLTTNVQWFTFTGKCFQIKYYAKVLILFLQHLFARCSTIFKDKKHCEQKIRNVKYVPEENMKLFLFIWWWNVIMQNVALYWWYFCIEIQRYRVSPIWLRSQGECVRSNNYPWTQGNGELFWYGFTKCGLHS